MKKSRTYKFSSKTLDQIDQLQEHHGLSSATSVLEFLVNKEHRMITPQPVKRIVNTIILKDKDKDTTLYNVSSGEQHWAELETAGDVEVVEEGTEYFCPDGLYVVEGDEWKEVECFHLDEYAAYYIEGGRPAFVTFANIVYPTRGSEVAKTGIQGEVYEVEGAALCVSPDGFSWEWVEEEEEVELPSREQCLSLWRKGNDAGEGFPVEVDGDVTEDEVDITELEGLGEFMFTTGQSTGDIAVYQNGKTIIGVGDAYGPWAVKLS